MLGRKELWAGDHRAGWVRAVEKSPGLWKVYTVSLSATFAVCLPRLTTGPGRVYSWGQGERTQSAAASSAAAMAGRGTGREGSLVEAVKNTLLILTALFPIVNPLGNTPIFLGLTSQASSAAREILSRRIAFNCFLLVIASLVVGTHILTFFGISLPVVQVGGGLIVISTGWTMLNWKAEERGEAAGNAVDPEDVLSKAFYPLTLPLTVGPGSISVAITLGANAPRHPGVNLMLLVSAVAGSLLIALSVYLSYSFAERLARILGPAAMGVIMRLSSFLLVCIGVQILWNGASALLESLPGFTH